jgi:hypothetical protein
MEDIIKALGNYRTTIVGAILGVLVYWQGVGAQLPRTEDEWFAFAVGTGLALFGALAKDGSTGSDPGARY